MSSDNFCIVLNWFICFQVVLVDDIMLTLNYLDDCNGSLFIMRYRDGDDIKVSFNSAPFGHLSELIFVLKKYLISGTINSFIIIQWVEIICLRKTFYQQIISIPLIMKSSLLNFLRAFHSSHFFKCWSTNLFWTITHSRWKILLQLYHVTSKLFFLNATIPFGDLFGKHDFLGRFWVNIIFRTEIWIAVAIFPVWIMLTAHLFLFIIWVIVYPILCCTLL